MMIKAKRRARESHRPVTPVSNNIYIYFFATILPKQTLQRPKGYVQGPSKHFVYALWSHVRMYSHVTTKRKNSMLSGWADKGSDWKNTSHVIGNHFIKISNQNVQCSKESLEGYPCFTPTPMVVHPCQFCQPIIFRGRESLQTRFKTNQCKVRRRVDLRKTTGTRENSEVFLIRSAVLSQ